MEKMFDLTLYYDTFHTGLYRIPESNVEKVVKWLQQKNASHFFEITNDRGADFISKPRFLDVVPYEQADKPESPIFGEEVTLYEVKLNYGTLVKTLTGVPRATLDDIKKWANHKKTAPYFYCINPVKLSYISRPIQMSVKEERALRRKVVNN